MKIRCAWCGKAMGEKEPLDNVDFTDGICDKCLDEYFPHLAEGIAKLNISQKDRYPEFRLETSLE